MALDLEALRKELEAYLEERKIPVFYGFYRIFDAMNQLSWNVETHPDFREFIAVGQKAGVNLFTYSYQSFLLAEVDDALELLEECMLPSDERRSYETRLRKLRAYEGFTCSMDLSFNLHGHTYTYSRKTDWYEALTETMAELNTVAELEEEVPDDDLGGYFSKN